MFMLFLPPPPYLPSLLALIKRNTKATEVDLEAQCSVKATGH